MKTRLKFPEALNLAMAREMEADPDVFAFGVDVQDHKRTFGSGSGLVEKFGIRRFFGSPLSEAAVTGVAVGAAMCGLRPIHIHARADFVLLAMNQLVNMDVRRQNKWDKRGAFKACNLDANRLRQFSDLPTSVRLDSFASPPVSSPVWRLGVRGTYPPA